MGVVDHMDEVIVQEIEPYRQEVAKLEQQAGGLQVIDDASEEAALLFIAECKRSYHKMEESRKERVKPLNEEVKAINGAYEPYTTVLERLWRATDRIRGAYQVKKQQAIEAANRKAIAEAEALKAEQERKAEEARKEAERIRLEEERIAKEEAEREYQAELRRLEAERVQRQEQEAAEAARRDGDLAAAREAEQRAAAAKAAEEEQQRKDEEARQEAEAEKARLAKAAIKQEVKADTAESRAMTTAPNLQSGSTKGIRELASGAKVGNRKAPDWCFTSGIDKEGTYYQDDPRVKDLPIRFFKLDNSKLGKAVKGGEPIPGTMKLEGIATTVRK